jgi:hypothetical protein
VREIGIGEKWRPCPNAGFVIQAIPALGTDAMKQLSIGRKITDPFP